MANVVCELLNLHPSAQPEDECLVQKHLFFVILKEFFLLKFLSNLITQIRTGLFQLWAKMPYFNYINRNIITKIISTTCTSLELEL